LTNAAQLPRPQCFDQRGPGAADYVSIFLEPTWSHVRNDFEKKGQYSNASYDLFSF
jgi:hypothetical protein